MYDIITIASCEETSSKHKTTPMYFTNTGIKRGKEEIMTRWNYTIKDDRGRTLKYNFLAKPVFGLLRNKKIHVELRDDVIERILHTRTFNIEVAKEIARREKGIALSQTENERLRNLK